MTSLVSCDNEKTALLHSTRRTNKSWELEDTSSLVSSFSRSSSFSTDDVLDHSSSKEMAATEIALLTEKDTHRVHLWRTFTALLLVATGALVSSCTYFILSRQLRKGCELSFQLFAGNIKQSAGFHFRNLFESNRILAREVTAYAIDNNLSFPFVTVNDFEIKAKAVMELSIAEEVVYSPKVVVGQRDAWEAYASKHQGWFNKSVKMFREDAPPWMQSINITADPIPPYIYSAASQKPISRDAKDPSFPIWTFSPPVQTFWINLDIVAPPYNQHYQAVEQVREMVFGQMDVQEAYDSDIVYGAELHQRVHDSFVGFDSDFSTGSAIQPHGTVMSPVFDSLEEENATIVGLITTVLSYDPYFVNLLGEGVEGIQIVMKTECGESFTYALEGQKAIFVGEGDLHDSSYDDQELVVDFWDYYQNPELAKSSAGNCMPRFLVYPSDTFVETFSSQLPITFAVFIAIIFLVMAVSFFMFSILVQRRNDKIMGAAVRTNVVLSSLFPNAVRSRLLETSQNNTTATTATASRSTLRSASPTTAEKRTGSLSSREIAELYPNTTVMFADISGFTAWSSAREPSQVFELLESVFGAFDNLAKKRNVFKVETIGDTYVAVCGLPKPRDDHAVVMAKFAVECMKTLLHLTRSLEVTLGPDTADLSLRIGLHSGPVTGGVLRGERARFQLFGETAAISSQMESTGSSGRIQVTRETAALLSLAGKGHWCRKRDGLVQTKGKGQLQTFWLLTKVQSDNQPNHVFDFDSTETPFAFASLESGKRMRLIEWNVAILSKTLKQIVARRRAEGRDGKAELLTRDGEHRAAGRTVLEEVSETITLPKFDAATAKEMRGDSSTIELGDKVVAQLRGYVEKIADMYRDNPFHNFEHASHVAMSVSKLLARIVAPVGMDYDYSRRSSLAESSLHDHTYGITSDPLTQFACILSAVLHDVDHPGVPNSQLIQEAPDLATKYKNQSVAEQRSVDLGWELFMGDEYSDLRTTICATQEERTRFRQLVVNSVMATDIVDGDLKALRNSRWEKAFSNVSLDENERVTINRKATIVIEHLIQASDVSHTMQHWVIYRKWNQRFFAECYQAFLDGRATGNPADNWYQGELGFFDFYIIPLANKLRECGVFGVSSDEYLNYAMKNREEWEARGKDIVKQMVAQVDEKHHPKAKNNGK